MNKDSPCWYRERAWHDTEFAINHYAGRVTYDAEGFVTKNMDTLPSDLAECAHKSTNEILANAMQNDGTMNVEAKKPKKRTSKKPPAAKKKQSQPNKRGSIAADSVWTKFRGQLVNLMSNLETTRSRYIRCIKPNQEKLALEMEHATTIEQLRCAGVVAAVTISRSAFPNRLEHEVVLDRFKSLWGKGVYPAEKELAEIEFEDQPKFLVEKLLASSLQSLELERNNNIIRAFVIGRSRTYFRAGSLEFLEAERLKYLGVWATDIQRIGRGFTQRSIFKKFKATVICLEAKARMKIAKSKYVKLKEAAIRTQCWLRCVYAARFLVLKRRYYRATMIQTHWRMAVAITSLKLKRKAAVVMQTMVRGGLQRPKFRKALHEKREEAKLENQLRSLQRKLEEAEQKRIEAERKAEEKAQKAVQDYRESTTPSIQEGEEKKVDALIAPAAKERAEDESFASAKSQSQDENVSGGSPSVAPSVAALSVQQQALMDESGKMLEYLRKEVFKLRNQNQQMRNDFDLLKDNNQRLMDANASAGASFAALNQHAKQLSKTNAKLTGDIQQYRSQIQKLNVTQLELKEELKMKQATYIAEVHSRLQYQKALGAIVELATERCSDTRLVEDILLVADECESEYMGAAASSAEAPRTGQGESLSGANDSMMSRFKFWG